MAFPVTLNGRTYTLTDFEGTNYVDGLPDAFEDFVTHAGDIYNSTSTTSNSIGTGSKTFTVEANKPYQAGTPLRIADAAAPSTNFLDTVVTSYSGTTLVVNSIGYGGSGTKTSWTVNIGGAKTVDGTLGLSQGGTGATDAAGARTNIDVYSKADADSRFLNVSGEASDVTMNGNTTIGSDSSDTLTINAVLTGTTGTFSTDGNEDTLVLKSNDADANAGPKLQFNRNSASADDGDLIGELRYSGRNDAGQAVDYARIRSQISDASDGTEDGQLQIATIVAGTTRRRVDFDPTETVFNDAAQGLDFRVESIGSNHALFVDASESRIGMGTASPSDNLHINSSGVTTVRLSGDTGSSYLIGEFSGATDGDSLMRMLGYQGSTFYGAVDVRRRISNEGRIVHRFRTNSANRDMNIFDGVESVFNEDSQNTDFRVESDNHTHALFVDASLESVGIRTSSTSQDYSLRVGVPSDDGTVTTPAAGIWTQCSTSSGQNHRSAQFVYTHGYYTATKGHNGIVIRNYDDSTARHAKAMQFLGSSGGEIGSIKINNNGTSFVTSSDYRLKENVVDLTGATERLKNLQPRRFNFIADSDGLTVDGFLAHEVSDIVPEAVTGEYNGIQRDENNDPILDENGEQTLLYQGIDQSKLVPLLVASIKELEARIAALESN